MVKDLLIILIFPLEVVTLVKKLVGFLMSVGFLTV